MCTGGIVSIVVPQRNNNYYTASHVVIYWLVSLSREPLDIHINSGRVACSVQQFIVVTSISHPDFKVVTVSLVGTVANDSKKTNTIVVLNLLA